MGQKSEKPEEPENLTKMEVEFAIPIYYSSETNIVSFLTKEKFFKGVILETKDEEIFVNFYLYFNYDRMKNIGSYLRGGSYWQGKEIKGAFLIYYLEDSPSNGKNLLESFEEEYKKMLKACSECKNMKFILIGVKNDFKEEFLEEKEDEAKKFCEKNRIEFGGFIDTKNEKESTTTMKILKENAKKILGYDEKEFGITNKIKTGEEAKNANYYF